MPLLDALLRKKAVVSAVLLFMATVAGTTPAVAWMYESKVLGRAGIAQNCDAGPPMVGDYGSFSNSCGNCVKVEGAESSVTATCVTRSARLQTSTLLTKGCRRGSIANQDGWLQCLCERGLSLQKTANGFRCG